MYLNNLVCPSGSFASLGARGMCGLQMCRFQKCEGSAFWWSKFVQIF